MEAKFIKNQKAEGTITTAFLNLNVKTGLLNMFTLVLLGNKENPLFKNKMRIVYSFIKNLLSATKTILGTKTTYAYMI